MLTRDGGAWGDGRSRISQIKAHSCNLGRLPTQVTLLPRTDRGRKPRGGGVVLMRPYEIMVILDPTLDERTVAPSLEAFLNVVRKDGGSVDKVDIWGRRRLAYEIAKHAEGIYAVVDVKAEPATVSELDRQLNLNESVLRTKVLRTDKH
jgi:small subunit ribosomal protein S6